MIKVDEKHTEVRGSIADITINLANAIRSVHNFWAKELSEEVADELLVAVGRMAVADNDSDRDDAGEVIVDLLLKGAMHHFGEENIDE